MKLLTLFILLPFSFLNAAPKAEQAQPTKPADKKIDTFQSLSEEFYGCVSSPAMLLLNIKDEKSLEKSLLQLKENQQRITELAARFEKLPIPSDAEKNAINAMMEEKEEKLNVLLKDRFMVHYKAIPDPLRNKWIPAMNAFYENLDAHQTTFSKYFETKAELEAKKKK